MTLILLTLLLYTSATIASPPALVAAASSTQFVLNQLTHEFNKETGLNVNISYGSSGNFSRQLMQGAPFELFIAADEYYISLLSQQHLTLDSGIIYACGNLALFIPHTVNITLDQHLTGLTQALNKQHIQRFAIANPQHAPYGKAAKELLMKSGIWQKIQPVLVIGENAAQATQYASSGMTQGGIIPYSYSLHPVIQKLGRSILLSQSLYKPFYARMVLMKTAGSTSKAFYQFLQSKKARDIFQKQGFVLPP